MCLFYNKQATLWISVDAEKFTVFNQQEAKNKAMKELGNHGYMWILNDEKEINFYYSGDGKAEIGWNIALMQPDLTTMCLVDS